MSAVQDAVDRGLAARSRRKPRWEPVGVEHRGWLVARVRDLRSGEVEGVFYAQGAWQFTKLGRDEKGKVKSFTVRDRELKRIAKAMIGSAGRMPHWRAELIREATAARRARVEAATE